MFTKVMKAIIGGALAGALLFFAGPIILLVLLLRFIFTPFGMYRMRYAGPRPAFAYARGSQKGAFAFADKIRTMSEEEYEAFKQRRANGC